MASYALAVKVSEPFMNVTNSSALGSVPSKGFMQNSRKRDRIKGIDRYSSKTLLRVLVSIISD